MTLCPNGQKPTIEWQYTGEDKQRIIGADNFSTQVNTPNFTGGQSPGIRYLIQVKVKRYLSDNNQFLQEITYNRIKIGPIEDVFLKTALTSEGYNRYTFLVIIDAVAVATGEPFEDFIDGFNIRNDLQSIAITREDGQPDTSDNLPSSCLFKVTKGNAVVYQKSAPTCPTVTHFCGDQCPSGTCQCDCGSEVCCYDTKTGKAVKSFRK